MDNPNEINTSGPTGPTGPAEGSVGEIKTRLANMLINRVSLSECLNVLRDACVSRANDIIDSASPDQLSKIEEDLQEFETPQSSGPDDSGPVTTGPVDSGPVDGSSSVLPELTPVDDGSGPGSGPISTGPQS